MTALPAPAAGHHLAQANVGRLLEPLDHPRIADFVTWLGPLNALADSSPGFVWRLQTDAGDATAVRAFDDDDTLLINMSVWESPRALWDFVYASRHLDALRRRRDWFERLAEAVTVLWWVPAGTVPAQEEAVRRLALLRREGPSPAAFTLREPFPPPG
jgi:Domain of unknown function (DUF3291)